MTETRNKTETLTTWELIALQKGIENLLESGKIHAESADNLIRKLINAKSIKTVTVVPK